MKYIFYLAYIVLIASALVGSAVYAQGGDLTYTPLEPIYNVPEITGNDFPALVKNLFQILFSLAGLLAVGMLVVGGIQYMVSSVAHIKAQALERARAAIFGIFILAGSWLILNTINPKLLDFSIFYNTLNDKTGAGGSVGGGGPSVVGIPLYEKYSASSASGQKYAERYGPLKDTKSGGALVIVNRSKLSDPSVIATHNTFKSECTADKGVYDLYNTSDPLLIAYVCKAN